MNTTIDNNHSIHVLYADLRDDILKTDYILGNNANEILRLKIQSSMFEDMAKDSLVKAGVKKGMICADIGCGPGYVTKMIGNMVGEKGRVVGIDINEDYIKYCKRNLRKKNMSFLCYDITKSKNIPDESFDITYSRFMFVHLSNKKKALEEIIRITKKNGTVIVQDLDHAPNSWFTYPKRQSVEKLRSIYVKLVKEAGGDPFVGRKIYKMFVEHGLDTSVECFSPCLVMKQKPYNELGWRIVLSLKNQILERGLMKKTEYDNVFNDLKKMSHDQHSFITYSRLFSIIGKKKR